MRDSVPNARYSSICNVCVNGASRSSLLTDSMIIIIIIIILIVSEASFLVSSMAQIFYQAVPRAVNVLNVSTCI